MAQPVDVSRIRERRDELSKSLFAPNGHPQNIESGVQSAISVLSLVYGRDSAQLQEFISRTKRGHGEQDPRDIRFPMRVAKDVLASLDAAVSDCDHGFVGSVRVRAQGEVLGDFVALSRTALEERNDGANRVAAVLAAAALEETLKQLGEASGLDVHNRDMRGVIQKLKDAGQLLGPQAGIANGLSKFRDNAFHGQFDQIERASTESALAFVEGLLTSRFV